MVRGSVSSPLAMIAVMCSSAAVAANWRLAGNFFWVKRMRAWARFSMAVTS